jgi:kynurenine formamidase
VNNSTHPDYADLPVRPDAPANSSWGVFGDADEVGTINLLTAERVRAAARLVRRGEVFPLNWQMELPDPPLFNRRALSHKFVRLEPAGTDDYYEMFFPQSSTHWDALCHTHHLHYGQYNQRTSEPADVASRTNGIEHWARRGIVGRFVLIDIAAQRITEGDDRCPGDRTEIDVAELERTLRAQQVEVERGDILLIRTGWLPWYESQPPSLREELAAADVDFESIGLAANDSVAQWLWDHEVAAVAADNPALEATPFDESNVDRYLHYRLIALLGMAVGELFNLEALSADSRVDNCFEGLLTSAPLNKQGGSGSPANALAIK